MSFVKNAFFLNESFGFKNTIILASANGITYLFMLFFGIRVAMYDPTDPVIYLQRMHKHDPKLSEALNKELLFEC